MLRQLSCLIPALLITTMAQAAMATPPDVITVRDVLFGSTKEQVMVLRTTTDNLGQYYAEQRDVLLLVIDRATGAERQYPVYRVRASADFDRDPQGDLRVHSATPRGGVDPFALLTAANGMPLLWDGEPKPADWNTATFSDEDGTVVLRFADEETASIPMVAILRHFDATLLRTAEVLGDYSRIAPVSTADLLEGRAQICNSASARRIDDRSGAPVLGLLRVNCELEEGGGEVSLLVPVKMDAKTGEEAE